MLKHTLYKGGCFLIGPLQSWTWKTFHSDFRESSPLWQSAIWEGWEAFCSMKEKFFNANFLKKQWNTISSFRCNLHLKTWHARVSFFGKVRIAFVTWKLFYFKGEQRTTGSVVHSAGSRTLSDDALVMITSMISALSLWCQLMVTPGNGFVLIVSESLSQIAHFHCATLNDFSCAPRHVIIWSNGSNCITCQHVGKILCAASACGISNSQLKWT